MFILKQKTVFRTNKIFFSQTLNAVTVKTQHLNYKNTVSKSSF